MAKEAANQTFLLTTIYCLLSTFYHTRTAILPSTINYFEHYYIILVQLWVAGEGPNIEWSYLPRKIVREKRLSFRGLEIVSYCAKSGRMSRKLSWCRGNTFPSPSNVRRH